MKSGFKVLHYSVLQEIKLVPMAPRIIKKSQSSLKGSLRSQYIMQGVLSPGLVSYPL